MHILFLTWKDIRHPHAGGAEKVMYEYARGLVQNGHEVTWFASAYPHSPSEEEIDGIRIIRKYHNHTIWTAAWWWYKKFKETHKVDAIIDEAGGWPLLSPLYEKDIPTYFFIHHIGDREFDAYPLALGRIAKGIYRKMISLYSKIPTITVSESTKYELIKDFGFSGDKITVIENTIDIAPITSVDASIPREDVVFLGRLTPIKRPHHAIEAFARVLPQLPKVSRLHIIGNNQDITYTDSLHTLALKLGINHRVVFHGFLPKEDTVDIFMGSRCLLVPSEKEGYGLVVIEANAYGIPVIAYDVPGLRESVKNGQNGILVPDGNIESMAQDLKELFAKKDAYDILSRKSLEYAQSIPEWKDQVKILEKMLISKK